MNKVTFLNQKQSISFSEVPDKAVVLDSYDDVGIKVCDIAGEDYIILLADATFYEKGTSAMFRVLQPGESITLTVEGE